MYKQGKGKIVKILEKYSDLREMVAVFNSTAATKENIANVGQKSMKAIYSGKQLTETTLSDLRYSTFKKCSKQKTFNLATLPPTESATNLHSYRVYYQVQMWLGNTLNPLDWGWKIHDNTLVPVYVESPLVPDDILKNISCKCTGECKKSCGCVKHGLRCSDFCKNCRGQTCKNYQTFKVSVDDNINEMNELDPIDKVPDNDESNELQMGRVSDNETDMLMMIKMMMIRMIIAHPLLKK